jgi:hypothetical protein
MIYYHDFFTGMLRKDEYISLPCNMSVLYIRDARSVSAQLIYGPAMVSMTPSISI